MNENHALCASPEWASYMQTEVLPPLIARVHLGARMLEIGPGPGVATDWLCGRVERLVVLEVDQAAAAKLRERYVETNVEVVAGDATEPIFPADSFDSVGLFTMLHHLATVTQQDRLLANALRTLRPEGVLVGADSLASDALHRFHDNDTYNPVEPGTLLTRLQTLGYHRITVSTDPTLTFTAYKPTVAFDT
jgi:SAM-dependent methyltransferase